MNNSSPMGQRAAGDSHKSSSSLATASLSRQNSLVFVPSESSSPENGQRNTGPRHYIKYLPICFGGSDCVRLSHIEVRIIDDNLEDDAIIFSRMRAAYNVRRGWIRRVLSVFEVKKIKLVKVWPLEPQDTEGT